MTPEKLNVYTSLKEKHGPIWIDINGEYHPLKFMSERHLTNCYKLCLARAIAARAILEREDILESSIGAGYLLFGEMAIASVDAADAYDTIGCRIGDITEKDVNEAKRMARLLAEQLRVRFKFDVASLEISKQVNL